MSSASQPTIDNPLTLMNRFATRRIAIAELNGSNVEDTNHGTASCATRARSTRQIEGDCRT
jgi:hypothetical protein